MITDPSFDQHMIKDMTEYGALLRSLHLDGQVVVELGVGTGSLTQAILAQNPARVIGYEIEASVVPADVANDTRVDMRIADFTKEDFSYLSGLSYVFASNPPYSQLPFIKEFLEKYPPDVLVMMVSEKKKRDLFPDDEVALRFRAEDFVPPTRGGHVVILRSRTS